MLNIDQSLENASYHAYPAKLQNFFTSVFGNNYKTTGIDTVLKSCINLLRNPASYFFLPTKTHVFRHRSFVPISPKTYPGYLNR